MADFQSIYGDLLDLENPMDKYEWIIDYGGGGMGLSSENKIEQNLVKGCTSSLWVVKINQRLVCDADSVIVKGFAGIICDWYNQATEQERSDFSIDTLSGVGLAPLLSMGRQNGIANLIHRIKKL
jgi:cysteine desulfuration protein SufE